MAEGAGDLVLFDKDGPLARLTLNRPEALNAVGLEMRDLLWTYLEAVRDDPDVRVIGLPEVNLGYIPSAGGTQTLPRQIPRGVALGMVMTGEQIDAQHALQLGLVHRVVPRAELDAAADEAALRLAALPQRALVAARE